MRKSNDTVQEKALSIGRDDSNAAVFDTATLFLPWGNRAFKSCVIYGSSKRALRQDRDRDNEHKSAFSIIHNSSFAPNALKSLQTPLECYRGENSNLTASPSASNGVGNRVTCHTPDGSFGCTDAPSILPRQQSQPWARRSHVHQSESSHAPSGQLLFKVPFDEDKSKVFNPKTVKLRVWRFVPISKPGATTLTSGTVATDQ